MKIYKVYQENKVINYQPIEENHHPLCIKIEQNNHHGFNFEQLFLSKEKADELYNQILEGIINGSDDVIENGNFNYYVKNIWDDNGYPYKTISSAYVLEIEVVE